MKRIAILFTGMVLISCASKPRVTGPDLAYRLSDLTRLGADDGSTYDRLHDALAADARRDPTPFLEVARTTKVRWARSNALSILGEVEYLPALDVACDVADEPGANLFERSFALHAIHRFVKASPRPLDERRIMRTLTRLVDSGREINARECISVASYLRELSGVPLFARLLARFPKTDRESLEPDVLRLAKRRPAEVRAALRKAAKTSPIARNLLSKMPRG